MMYRLLKVLWVLGIINATALGVITIFITLPLNANETKSTSSKTSKKSDSKKTNLKASKEVFEELIEAEDLFIINGDAAEMFQSDKIRGYTGGGYLNFNSSIDAQVLMTVYGKGEKTIFLKYATRYADVYVDIMSGNETLKSALRLEGTGGYWLEKAFVITLTNNQTELKIAPILSGPRHEIIQQHSPSRVVAAPKAPEALSDTEYYYYDETDTNTKFAKIKSDYGKYRIKYNNPYLDAPEITSSCPYTADYSHDGFADSLGKPFYYNKPSSSIISHARMYRPVRYCTLNAADARISLRGIYLSGHYKLEVYHQHFLPPDVDAFGVDFAVSVYINDSFVTNIMLDSSLSVESDVDRDNFPGTHVQRTIQYLRVGLSNAKGIEYDIGFEFTSSASEKPHVHLGCWEVTAYGGGSDPKVALSDTHDVITILPFSSLRPAQTIDDMNHIINMTFFKSAKAQKKLQKKIITASSSELEPIELTPLNPQAKSVPRLSDEDQMGFNLDSVRVSRGVAVEMEIMEALELDAEIAKNKYILYEAEDALTEGFLFRGRAQRGYTGKGYVNIGVRDLLRRRNTKFLSITIEGMQADSQFIYDRIALRYASPLNDLKIQVLIDAKAVKTIHLKPSDGWGLWKESDPINLGKSIQNGMVIRLERLQDNLETVNFNLDHIKLLPRLKTSPQSPSPEKKKSEKK